MLQVVGLVIWGCGGSEAAKAGDTTISPSSSRASSSVPSSGGVPINARAQSKWNEARTIFDKYEKDGWTEDRCEKAADAFKAASDELSGRFVEAIFMTGLAWERCGQKAKALEFYQKANQTDPKFCKARVALGVEMLQKGQRQEAQRVFSQAIQDDGQCTEGYVNLAIIQHEQGGGAVKDALDNLRRALAIDSRYLPAFNQLAVLYLEQSKAKPELLELAAVVCRQAQLIDKNYAPIYNTWGLVNVRKGDIIEATRMFERATQLDPQLFESHLNFGNITLSFRGYEDAKRAFEKAVQLQPSHYEARLGLGAALRGSKNYQGALTQYQKAVEISSGRPEAYYNMGIIYNNHLSGSIADLQQAKRHFNDFLARVRGETFSAEVKELRAQCQQSTKKSKRNREKKCRPGRLQIIDESIANLQGAKKS